MGETSTTTKFLELLPLRRVALAVSVIVTIVIAGPYGLFAWGLWLLIGALVGALGTYMLLRTVPKESKDEFEFLYVSVPIGALLSAGAAGHCFFYGFSFWGRVGTCVSVNVGLLFCLVKFGT